jgi:predicted alpha/beta-hydrolase family hydrolase
MTSRTPPTFRFDGPAQAPGRIVLAHGAGAPMDDPFLETIATSLAARGNRVARFEFPYMAQRRAGGPRRAPDRSGVLLDCWRAAVATLGDPARLVIGGKSLGGRIASLVADELGVRGLVCLGYPFRPPRAAAPAALRTAHLETLCTPTLIVQGTRDPFGGPALVAGLALSAAVRIQWIDDGDHSFAPRRSSGRTPAQNLAAAVDAVAAFVTALRDAPS